MLFVVVQNAALAAMAPIGHYIAKRLGFDGKQACLLSIALLPPVKGMVIAIQWANEMHGFRR